MLFKRNADKFRDQIEDGNSSVITSESHGPRSSLFDTGDRLTITECGLTEPTSVGPEEVLGKVQELRMESSDVMQESSADEDALLLSDLDIDEHSVEDSLDEVEERERQDNVDDAFDLENTNFPPSEDVTSALDDFGSVEATLRQPPSPVAETSVPALRCVTQESSMGPVDEINLGLHNTIWRWKWNSNIEFNVNSRSFPLKVDVKYAKESLETAAREWNKGFAGVQFVSVGKNEPVVFQLTYLSSYSSASDEGDTLARAFLPKDPDALDRLQKLFVYPLAFNKEHKPNMTNVFCHELGHILGLRHEFAPQREAKVRSVRWGDKNPSSVMNYHPDWSLCRIQPSDYASVRSFYSFRGTEYRGFKIRDLAPRRFNPEPPPPPPSTSNFSFHGFPKMSW